MAIFDRGDDDKAKNPDVNSDSSDQYLDGELIEINAPANANVIDSETGVKRALKTRHLSMMALAGIIGAGLFIGTGTALAEGGPAALLIGFGVIGTLSYSVMQCVGEMAVLYPAGGSFLSLNRRFVNKPFAAVIGWNYFIVWIAVLANEYNVITNVLTAWSDKVPVYGYFLIFWFFFLTFQMGGIQVYGEAEFWLALIKLLGLVAFFIFAVVYVCGGVHGHPALGFHYWNDPGPWANGFRGVAKVFIYCSTFYSGCESICISATECRNPGRSIPVAIRQVVWRILFVFMGTAFIYGMSCPYNDEGLQSGQKIIQSPMSIVLRNAGWKGGYNLINAFILITLLSATNSAIYIGSRTILYLAAEGCAPKFMGYTNKRGVPVYAVLITNLFGFLALMNIGAGAAKAYGYIVNLSGVSVFIVWGGLALTHFRFRRSLKLQNFTELPYKFRLYPYNTWYCLILNSFLALVQGWTSFSPFNAGDFIDAYILLPVSALLYVAVAIRSKEWKFHTLESIDLSVGRRSDFDNDSGDQKSKWYEIF